MSIRKEIQEKMSPEAALERLLKGNQRFVEQRMHHSDYLMQVQNTADGQYPFAAVLGCIDSRAPAELIFNQGIGDIFHVRVAGNIVNVDVLGSLEYACRVAGAKLVLVMGHTSCGAVTSAVQKVDLGNITALLSKIAPAIEAMGDRPLEIDRVAHINVQLNIRRIRSESSILADMEAGGEILIRGAMYDVATGMVSLLDE